MIPDGITPRVAWRGWRVVSRGGAIRLSSTTAAGDVWEPGKPLRAECRSLGRRADMGTLNVSDPAQMEFVRRSRMAGEWTSSPGVSSSPGSPSAPGARSPEPSPSTDHPGDHDWRSSSPTIEVCRIYGCRTARRVAPAPTPPPLQGPRRHRLSRYQPESAEALASIDPRSIAGRILEYLRVHPSTTDEVEQRLEMRHQTASAAISKMWGEGRIEDSGIKRRTRSGRRAIVYRAKPVEQTALL